MDDNLAAFQEESDHAGLENAYGVFGAMTTIEGYVNVDPAAEVSGRANLAAFSLAR